MEFNYLNLEETIELEKKLEKTHYFKDVKIMMRDYALMGNQYPHEAMNSSENDGHFRGLRDVRVLSTMADGTIYVDERKAPAEHDCRTYTVVPEELGRPFEFIVSVRSDLEEE